MSEKKSLEELRKEITQITLKIMNLCGERQVIAKKIGEIKAQENLPIEDSIIEEILRKKVLKTCEKNNLKSNYCLNLLEMLLDESILIQRNLRELDDKKMGGQ
jgi:chorismate mutase